MAAARGAFRLNPPTAVEEIGRRLNGHLELICDADARGQTRLRHQSFSAPVHLSKPHWDGGALVLNIVNPTAGFLEGDRLRAEVSVERGARLLLTTPSASRVHTMRGEGWAAVRQHFQVMAGGSLEYWPELLIPQRGARYRQRTQIDLEPGAELLFFESMAPGRVASGEAFEFAEVRWETDLRLSGRPLARERWRLAPGERALEALRRRFPFAYYASAFLVSPALDARSACWEAIHARHDDREVWIGVSALPGGGAFALKIIAADSLILRRTLRAAREAVHSALGRTPPGLRRAGE
jgi:urease accessory protein